MGVCGRGYPRSKRETEEEQFPWGHILNDLKPFLETSRRGLYLLGHIQATWYRGEKAFSTDICLNRHKHSNIFPNGFPLSGLLLGSSSCFSLSIFNFLRLSPSLQPRLTWDSQWSSCLILHSAGIRGVNPHSKINFPSSEPFLHITGVFLLWFLHVVSLYTGSGIICHCVSPMAQSWFMKHLCESYLFTEKSQLFSL